VPLSNRRNKAQTGTLIDEGESVCPGSYWTPDADAVGFPDRPGIVDEEGDMDGVTVEGWHGACIDS